MKNEPPIILGTHVYKKLTAWEYLLGFLKINLLDFKLAGYLRMPICPCHCIHYICTALECEAYHAITEN